MRQLISNKSYIIILASTLLCFVIGILGNLLGGLLQHYVLEQTFEFVSITSILALTVAGFFIGMWLEHQKKVISIKKAMYWILVILVTGTIALATILSSVYATLRPPMTYFLVDATNEMKPLFEDVRTQVGIAVAPNDKVGLSIYSGNMDASTECGNTRQLIEPGTYRDPGTELETSLSAIKPGGQSSLRGAVLQTLKNLAAYDEPIQLVIITSGTNLECDSLQERFAGNINSNINIVFISIGQLSSHTSQILENYVSAFHGAYLNIPTTAQLSQAIQAVPGYSSQDYYYLYPKLTPSTTP